MTVEELIEGLDEMPRDAKVERQDDYLFETAMVHTIELESNELVILR